MLNYKKIGKHNVCLVGLMGSGKSMIGRELARIFSINHYDSDNEIELYTGMKIINIFDKYGEDYFRKIEKKVCLKLLNIENCVISLGGGSLNNNTVRKKVMKRSYSIYLKVDIKNLVKRLLSSKKRPLLEGVNKKSKLEEIYNERKKFYNQADLIIENNTNKKEILEVIKNKLN